MKALPPGLINWLLAKKPCFPVDLFTFTLSSGSTICLCSYAYDIVYDGVTFYGAGNPVVTRSGWEIKNTIEVPSLDIMLLSTGSDWNNGANIKRAIINGLLDGSTMLLQRVYLNPQTGAQIGGFDIYNGVCGAIVVGTAGAKITYRGANVRMDQNYPKNVYTTGCIWSLYGPGCLVTRASYEYSGITASGSSVIQVNWASDPTGGKYANLALGTLVFTSGINEGEKRSIQSATTTGVQLMYPLDSVPAAGDTFIVAFGCTKTLTYCKNVFANNQKWRGFPFVPPAETTL